MIDLGFATRFTEMLEKSGISNVKLNEMAGISKNNIGNYKNGQIPNATTLYKLSQIFGTSMEYLLTGKEAPDLSPEEQELVDHFRRSNDTGKSMILNNARMTSEQLPEQRSTDSRIG